MTDFHPNFPPDVLDYSETAARKAINNAIPEPLMGNAKRLSTVLGRLDDACRASFGKGIIVSSGYRSPALNDAVGGAQNSDHLHALAADIVVPGVSVNALAALALATFEGNRIPFNQIIIEFGRWVHIGLAKTGSMPRQELLTAQKIQSPSGKLITAYYKGFREAA